MPEILIRRNQCQALVSNNNRFMVSIEQLILQ
jgi:hypothetical protein